MEMDENNKTVSKDSKSTLSWREKFCHSFSKYSDESTIHSMKYIGKRDLHVIERAFWILAFMFAFTTCTYLIIETYLKWNHDPMLVTLKEKATPTWKIPFPAITICPETKSDAEKLNFTRIIDNINDGIPLNSTETAALKALNAMCTEPIKDLNPQSQNESKLSFIEILNDIKINFANLSNYIWASSTKHSLTDTFHETITDEGVCRSFNMLNGKDIYKDTINRHLRLPRQGKRSNWNPYGYDEHAHISTHPSRVLGAGMKAGITIFLNMRKLDVDYACNQMGNGFRLTLHLPNEMPQISSQFFRIPFGVETLIAVTPTVMSTSETMRHYKPVKRQCFFPGEKRLKFFKAYTQENCKLECFTEYILRKCGCVKFSMPHTNGTKICQDLKCINTNRLHWILLDLGKNMMEQYMEQNGGTVPDISKKEEDGMIGQLSSDDTTFYEYGMKYDKISNSTMDNEYDSIDSSSSHEYDTEEYDYESESDEENEFKACKCLPSCMSVVYEAEVSQTSFDLMRYHKARRIYQEEDVDWVRASVTIYFKEDHFVESKRSELYGWLNFLSNCGGLLGLLMGGSLLSLVEIFYHLTLRKIFRSVHLQNQ